jgi:hypothetical protein
MKKYFFLMLACLFLKFSHSQVLQDDLEGVRFWKNDNGILITGFIRNGSNLFQATLYSAELKLISQFQKELSSEFKVFGSIIYAVGNGIMADISTTPRTVICLNEKLEEIGEFPKPFNKIPIYFNGYHYEETTFINPSDYTRSIRDSLAYKDENLCLYITNQPVKRKELGDDYIRLFNRKTQKDIFRVKANFPDSLNNFFASNALYDVRTSHTIVAGILYNTKGKIVMHSIALLIYDKEGKLISSAKTPIEEPSRKLPAGWKMKEACVYIKKIGHLENGNLFLHAETSLILSIDKTTSGMTVSRRPCTIYYSCYELNNKFEIIGNKSEDVLNERTKNNVYLGSSEDGRFMLVTDTDRGVKKTSFLDFNKEKGTRTITFETFDYKMNNNFDFNPNYDTEFYTGSVIGSRAVIFHKKPSSNQYSLKSVTFPK